MNIGKRIRLFRENRGWSQETLAQESGVPQATISKSERGKVNPLFETVLKISGALEIGLDKLVGIQFERTGKGIDQTLLWQLEEEPSLVEALKNSEIVKLVKELSPEFPSSKVTSKNNDLKILLNAANKILEK